MTVRNIHTHMPKNMLKLGLKSTHVSDSGNNSVFLKDVFPKLGHTFQTNSDSEHRFSSQNFEMFTSGNLDYGAN